MLWVKLRKIYLYQVLITDTEARYETNLRKIRSISSQITEKIEKSVELSVMRGCAVSKITDIGNKRWFYIRKVYTF